jgi:hypothetical protein
LYTLEEPCKKRTKSRRSPESRYRLHRGFTKDVDYDIEFIGGIKNSIFGGEGLRHPSRPWNRLHTIFTFQQTRTELLLQHLKQEEIAAVKEAYYGLGNLLDGDNRIKFYYPAIL